VLTTYALLTTSEDFIIAALGLIDRMDTYLLARSAYKPIPTLLVSKFSKKFLAYTLVYTVSTIVVHAVQCV